VLFATQRHARNLPQTVSTARCRRSRLTLRCPGREQIRVLSGFPAMRIPEENRNMVLLATVTLVCALIAIVAGAFEPEASTAQTASKKTALADQPAVRVVGVPFVPNTNPREHN
jgi:hypothetical protein